MELILDLFSDQCRHIYITKVWHWVGVPSISPLMMVSKSWSVQNTVF